MNEPALRSLADKLPGVGTTIFSVMSQLAVETGAINLSQGFPDLPLDPVLIGLVHDAMREGRNQYAPMPGVPELREAIAHKVEDPYGAVYDPGTEITITAGATQAIFTTIMALIHPGDEVIVIDPAYDCYAPAVRLAGGTPVHVPVGPDMRFDADAVRAAIDARTRMLIINSPHNPAGRILRGSDLQQIRQMLAPTDILLLSDEVYEHIVFDGERHESVMLHSDLRDRSVVVLSFGKTYHGTGWKIGYVIAPAPLMKLIRKVHQFNVFSVNTPMQHALAAYMRNGSPHLQLADLYQQKRDRFLAGARASRFDPLPCEGSYFQVMEYSRISEEKDLVFAERLAREHGVAAIPLSPFYNDPPKDRRLLRFCFAKQDHTLDLALERLCAI